jgi:hypothetical protein
VGVVELVLVAGLVVEGAVAVLVVVPGRVGRVGTVTPGTDTVGTLVVTHPSTGRQS